jgi:hypothetical protein
LTFDRKWHLEDHDHLEEEGQEEQQVLEEQQGAPEELLVWKEQAKEIALLGIQNQGRIRR